MQEALEKRTDISFQKSRLIYCLMNADYEYEASGQDIHYLERSYSQDQ